MVIRYLISLSLVLVLSESAFAADTNAVRRLRRSGGMITREASGLFVVFDCQSQVKSENVETALSTFARPLRIATRWVGSHEAFAIGKAASCLSAEKATAAVFVIDDATLPVALAAPEDHWGFVNVARLAASALDGDMLTTRFEKEFARVSSIVLGAWSSPALISVLQPAANMADLDRIGSTSITPDSMPPIMAYISKIGFTQTKTVPYRLACKQGWAPAPTNEFQKAVWDEVHAIPTKPIKIEFDPKTDTK